MNVGRVIAKMRRAISISSLAKCTRLRCVIQQQAPGIHSLRQNGTEFVHATRFHPCSYLFTFIIVYLCMNIVGSDWCALVCIRKCQSAPHPFRLRLIPRRLAKSCIDLKSDFRKKTCQRPLVQFFARFPKTDKRWRRSSGEMVALHLDAKSVSRYDTSVVWTISTDNI